MTGSMRTVRAALMLLAATALVFTGARPAAAHEDDDENAKAADLVRQAIALIVNTPDDIDAINDKITDAGTAEDTSGVDLELVEQAGVAFGSGDLHEARALLERSIGAQPHLNEAEPPPIRETTPTTAAPAGSDAMDEMGDTATGAGDAVPSMTMATGADPGAELIADSLEVRPNLDGGDRALLAASIVVGLAGVWLGLRWRPPRRSPA